MQVAHTKLFNLTVDYTGHGLETQTHGFIRETAVYAPAFCKLLHSKICAQSTTNMQVVSGCTPMHARCVSAEAHIAKHVCIWKHA